MSDTQNTVLQLTDSVTGRRCALRISQDDAQWPLERLLDRYLKRPAVDELLAERRITRDSADDLADLQDLAYLCSDDGRLGDMFAGVEFWQDSRLVALDQALSGESVLVGEKHATLIDVVIDRTNVGYDRNWKGFNRRRWARRESTYMAFVSAVLEESYGAPEAERVLGLDSTAAKLELVEALARRIWHSDFENYSRFTGRKRTYKWGDETVLNVIDGGGGICSEKVQALKFLTDHYGLESEIVLAGPDVPDPVPEDRLRELLDTLDFSFSRRFMRYWQHTALLYRIDGTSVLVDDTNGNIPFLFAKGGDARRILGYGDKRSIPVKMSIYEEDFYYHRVRQDISQDLFFAMEGWIPDIDLVQVFDNELGLYVSSDFMVMPVAFRSEKEFERTRDEYLKACGDAGVPCSVEPQWELESDLASRFVGRYPDVAEKIMGSRDRLVERSNEAYGQGHEAGLMVMGLPA